MGASDSPYVSSSSNPEHSGSESVATTVTDNPPRSSPETPAARDGGSGGGEAFDNPGQGSTNSTDTGRLESSNEAAPDVPPQVTSAPDGGAGGGEAFDNPPPDAASTPPDPDHQEQRQEATTDDQPTDDQPTEVPERANQVADYARTHNDSPPPGYKGNRVYENDNQALPEGGDYREYDIDPNVRGTPRNAERIVVDRNTGESWYTPDHYNTFQKMGQ